MPQISRSLQKIVEEGDGLRRLLAGEHLPGFGKHGSRRRQGVTQFPAQRVHERVDEAASAQRRLGEEGADAQRAELVEPVRILHDAAGAELGSRSSYRARSAAHSLDIGAFHPVLGEHAPGEHGRVLLFRHVVLVVFALMKFARIMVERDQDRQKRIDAFACGQLMGDGRRALGMLQQEFRGRLFGLAVVARLGLDERLLDARVQPGKA